MHSNLENQSIFLAPMEDITDYPFRQVLSKIGRPDVFFTEFVNVNGLVSRGRKNVLHRLEFSKDQRPIILQLWGRDPKKFKDAFDFVQDFNFDGVNINLGCPVKKVLKAGCGSALIGEFEIVEDIVRSLENSKIPVSIKTRIGKDGFDVDWIDFLLGLNIDTLFIHGRTAKQVFSGLADWESISKIVEEKEKKNLKMKIVGNGDVKSLEQADEFKERFGVDGVMIGREVLKNPWVFSRERFKEDISNRERFDTLLYHLVEMKKFCENFDGKNWPSVKKFYFGYLREQEDLVQKRKELFEINDIDDAIEFLKEKF